MEKLISRYGDDVRDFFSDFLPDTEQLNDDPQHNKKVNINAFSLICHYLLFLMSVSNEVHDYIELYVCVSAKLSGVYCTLQYPKHHMASSPISSADVVCEHLQIIRGSNL